YRSLNAFARQGINNKLVLLHGPNGSAKSSLIHSLMGGIERYSLEREGALYTFGWVFPIERYTKSAIGLNTYSAPRDPLQNYAKLPDEEVASRIPCDMKDHPFLLIPKEHRKGFLEKLLGSSRAETIWSHLPLYFTRGDLCHRCKLIYDSLLVA